MKSWAIIFVVSVVISCNDNPKKDRGTKVETVPVIADTITDFSNPASEVVATSRRVLSLLKNKSFIQLSALFHPTRGIRFSPYGLVDTSSHMALLATDFLAAIKNKQRLYWGSYDGTGDSIVLTAAQYYNKFIYNADFLNAEKSSLDKRISTGNSLDNLATVYPGCNYTEHYFSGFNKKYGGMDWTSLKLVFSFYEGRIYLVAIVHDQWTT